MYAKLSLGLIVVAVVLIMYGISDNEIATVFNKAINICVPGLNCYSCPGAFGACPIGALQAVLDSSKFKFSCYVLGFLMMFGSLLGRFAWKVILLLVFLLCDIIVYRPFCKYICPLGAIYGLFILQGVSDSNASRMSLCVEEFGSNVIKWGFSDNKPHSIDIYLFFKNGVWTLRMRDDCESI